LALCAGLGVVILILVLYVIHWPFWDNSTELGLLLEQASRRHQAGAIADCTMLIERNPSADMAYNCRGAARGEKGDLDGAIADCTKAIELNPGHWTAFSDRGRAYLLKADPDRAIADCTRAIKINSGAYVAYIIRGTAHRENGELDQAFADCTRAIECDPSNHLGYFQRGLIQLLQGKDVGALGDFESASTLRPDLKPSLDRQLREFKMKLPR
jgi:tetratricopeptide (TPR) repeat protein